MGVVIGTCSQSIDGGTVPSVNQLSADCLDGNLIGVGPDLEDRRGICTSAVYLVSTATLICMQ